MSLSCKIVACVTGLGYNLLSSFLAQLVISFVEMCRLGTTVAQCSMWWTIFCTVGWVCIEKDISVTGVMLSGRYFIQFFSKCLDVGLGARGAHSDESCTGTDVDTGGSSHTKRPLSPGRAPQDAQIQVNNS